MVYLSSIMDLHGHTELGDLEDRLACKEKEWKELQAARVHQLESSLRKAQEECCLLRERHRQMKEDFKFNLGLLDERDRELERYDVVTSRALTAEDKRQEEVKQLRLQVSRLEEQRTRETEQWLEELSESQHSAAQYRLKLEELKLSMAGEIQKRTEENERMKLDLQCRIREVEGELTEQRQEMTAAFDCELKQQEHKFNMRMDEMRAIVLSHDLREKLLSKEVEVHSQVQLQTGEALKASQELCQQIQTQLQHKEQQIRDLSSVQDCRIKEIEEELKLKDTRLKKEEEDHMKKYEDVIRALRDCETQLEAQRQAHTDQLQKAEKHIVKLQEDMKVQTSQGRQAQRDQQRAMEQKDETIIRHHTEVERIRTGWEEYVSHVSSEMVVKDTEMIALKEREIKLKTELERSREEMEGYKQQLSAGLQRERALEQKRVQGQLEWQRRCEDVKAELYLANEQLIRDLTQARDQAQAELTEKEQELQDLTVLLRSVKTERDQALQGLTPKVDYLASEEIRRLQEQSGVLRAVVNQMRKDMECLSHLPLPLHPQAQPQTSSPQHPTDSSNTQVDPEPPAKVPPAGYSEALEQEVSLLKARCRHLKEQLEGATGQPGPADKPTEDLPSVGSDSRQLQGPEQGGSCLEKCANTSAIEKQGVRVSHGESALISITAQSALVQKLQEENLRLRQQQQQTSALMSGGLFDKRDPAHLHSRLKQAALCITRLSTERQQLIKMGNRLRAQITTAGLQESAEPQRDSSAETQGDQQGRLCALEQLQYQLTTQELQYALRLRDHSVSEQPVPVAKSRGPAVEGATNPWTQGHKTPDRPEPLSGLSRSLLSSEESLRSLKELWEKLDQGLSPSTFSEGELSRREGAEGGAGGQMTMQGVSAPIHSLPLAEGKQKRNTSAAPSNINKTRPKPGAPGGTGKIRNYNMKD
ncbi:coiled-coil domain-containing protein 57 [Notolabrus celidotus]|uniref:coiled-coil domain-containing protein 57 n=1 Tax=Notolabrus celidotus TaxID=1203425 RepID=UPI0014906FBA|nr:coiled-coil domain-containing protein 57 [Notolabrus celidotus]